MNVKRREPRQKRAKVLVDSILSAAEELIESSGFSHLSTNKIAERAGVSIGSLYQYYNNKEEIFSALIRRRTHQDKEFIFSFIEEFNKEENKEISLDEALEQLIAGFLFLVSQQIELRNIIISYAPIYGVQHILNNLKDEVALELAEFIKLRKFAHIEESILKKRTKLLVYSVEYLIYQESLLQDKIGNKTNEAFVIKELVTLAKSYLLAAE